MSAAAPVKGRTPVSLRGLNRINISYLSVSTCCTLLRCYVTINCWQAQRSPLRPNKGLLKFLHMWQKTSGGSLPATAAMRKGFPIGLKIKTMQAGICTCTKSTQVSVTSLPPGVHHWAASISNHFVIPLPRFSVDGLTHCTQTRVISSNQ